MEDDRHSTKIRLPDRPGSEWVHVKTRWAPIDVARGSGACDDNQVDRIRLRSGRTCKLRMLLFLVLSCYMSTALPAPKPASTDAAQASPKSAHHAGLDRSGKARKGEASYYGRKFYSKKMADGTRMDPQSNVAASKTLPLGTKARVTNLENGNNEVVEIRDRGPYVKDRIVDVSPKTADKLGLKEDGTAPVEVKPVEVPQPDGSVKPGAGATDNLAR